MLMHAMRFSPQKRRWLIGGLVLLALGGIIWMVFSGMDWQSIPRAMNRLNSATILLLAATLPLAGFPISVVYLLIGARFGPLPGLGIVGVITALHLLGTHWITRSFLRRPFLLFMAGHRHRVPEVPPGENIPITLMAMLAPAVPYAVRNYVLALSGIPLRIYFVIALPIHVLHSYVVLFLGDFSSSRSRHGLILPGVFYATLLVIFAGLAWWLRRRHKRMSATRSKKDPDSP